MSVEAVKSFEDRIFVEKQLRKYGDIYSDIWKLGINVGLRISDLLAIRYQDMDLESRTLHLKEKKTGKSKTILLNNTVVNIVNRRRKMYPHHHWLFEVECNRATGKAISRSSVSRVFKEVGDSSSIQLNTHSMRKTRGYALYADGKPIELIAKVLNHSSPSVTMNYLGITKEEVLQTYVDYEL